ncbi:hypothetical protein [Pseudorhodobacter sp. E13]|uniref:hypothetical protein n=1 Tax=Pseudorhodobacter sp. E13 TaxID=2487931 RepID=UPI001315395D|nr:hypothetical protein [Pseudorhodobacter sp. E13]
MTLAYSTGMTAVRNYASEPDVKVAAGAVTNGPDGSIINSTSDSVKYFNHGQG